MQSNRKETNRTRPSGEISHELKDYLSLISIERKENQSTQIEKEERKDIASCN